MPNFNGAIVMHTLEILESPATQREIILTIAQKTELQEEQLKEPVKQTLDMGVRFGYLQKMNGKYLTVPMTFDKLLAQTAAIVAPAPRPKSTCRKAATSNKVDKEKLRNMELLGKLAKKLSKQQPTEKALPPPAAQAVKPVKKQRAAVEQVAVKVDSSSSTLCDDAADDDEDDSLEASSQILTSLAVDVRNARWLPSKYA